MHLTIIITPRALGWPRAARPLSKSVEGHKLRLWRPYWARTWIFLALVQS